MMICIIAVPTAQVVSYPPTAVCEDTVILEGAQIEYGQAFPLMVWCVLQCSNFPASSLPFTLFGCV